MSGFVPPITKPNKSIFWADFQQIVKHFAKKMIKKGSILNE